MKKTMTIAALAALAGIASAQIESTTDLAVVNAGPLPSNALPTSGPDVTYTFANSFTLGDIGWSGNASTINSGTFGSELVGQFYLNGVAVGFAQLGSGATYAPGAAFSGTAGLGTAFYGTAITAGDVWGFEFVESYDDGGDGLADAQWDDITFDFFDNFVAPPTLADLSIGTLVSDDTAFGNTVNSSNDLISTSGNAFLGGGTSETGGDDVYEINWGGGRFFGSLNFDGSVNDLDLFLYDANDDLVDSAFTTSDPEIIDIANLPAGTYYARADGFFGDAGNYALSITPAPGTAALLGLAGFAGIRRRRA